MNERIAKLYDQAIVIEDGGDYVCGELDVEKFAELIMQESREWVGLTDEDMKDHKTHNFDFIHGARWAEAKLKDKNR